MGVLCFGKYPIWEISKFGEKPKPNIVERTRAKNTFEIVVKSLRIQGFMLDSFMEDFAAHVPESRQEIFEMWLQNKLQTR